MRFKIDENLPNEVSAVLAAAGHDVTTVVEEKMIGASDAQLIEKCRNEGRALLTLDWDFADIRTYPPQQFPGLLVLRPSTQEKERVLTVVQRLVRVLAQEQVEGRLWIVDENKARIRGGAPQEQ